MAVARTFATTESLLDFLVRKASPEEILAYQASEEEQERADELTEKSKVGKLSPEEQEELEEMLASDAFVASLKAHALELLSQP